MQQRILAVLNLVSIAVLAVLCSVPAHSGPAAYLQQARLLRGEPHPLAPATHGSRWQPESPAPAVQAIASAASTVGLVAGPTKKKQEDADTSKKSLTVEELTLERLFPEESLWGPSASNTSFSADGRFGAYLYRPRIERRHGNDLYLYDAESGEARRVTMASVMSEYQSSARKVRDDRREKAKKRQDGKDKGKSGDGKSEGASEAAVSDDGISGLWEGNLTLAPDEDVEENEEEIDGGGAGRAGMLPPGGVTFTLDLKRDEDDTFTGTFAAATVTAAVREGTWRAEEKTLELTLADTGSDLTGRLEAELVDTDTLEGVLAVPTLDLQFKVAAKRVRTLQEQIEEEKRQEQEEGTQDGSGDDEADNEGDGGDDGKSDKSTEDTDDEEIEYGDVVDDEDAKANRDPRYSGIETYVWSPTDNELIFTSEGDLYQLDVESGEITRLTRTREAERDVQYLPDGSGYTYLRDNELVRVCFGSHLIEQLDPALPGGELMTGYRISPDGKRLVFVATRGESYWSRGRRVNIVDYRDRFARVREVVRHMPDDPYTDFEWSVYLYDLSKHQTEGNEPKKVYTHKQTGPRDIFQVPAWSPDSLKAAWSVFRQDLGNVEILEAEFVAKEESEAKPAEDETKDDASVGEEQEQGESEDQDAGGVEDGDAEAASEPEYEIRDARVIYRFYHHGGPNTPRMIEPIYLPDSHRLAFLTEMSGFRHVHVLDPTYEQLDQVTRGRFEVYPFQVSRDHRYLFATTTQDDPAQERIFKIDLASGEMKRLCVRDGFYSGVAVSDDGRHVLANHIDFGSLRELLAVDCEAGKDSFLTDSHVDELRLLTEPTPEYFTYENRHGQEIHGHMFKPEGWTDEDHRPLLIYVYGGPLGTRKMVSRGAFSGDSYFFAYYMAKKHGYVTCTIDPRGASGYGGLFEKSNFEQVGKPQVEDLVDGARWMIANQGVDPKRVGIHGWSFGGFQTQMCLYTEPEVFAAGIAGAGPTEWENYNSWYSTGTIGSNRTGQTDLGKFSLLPLAKNLKAKLLLVHGMEDSNVLYQDTVRVYRELLKAGKETLVELFLDPTGGHGLGGDVKSLNRFRKYEEFLLRTLGTGATTHPAAGDGGDADAEQADDDDSDPKEVDGDAERDEAA